ncbi:DUF317 domain-containing protein [Streptomyces sp. NPDC050095]|uniref:DUF317 domain-containing protein n=1 Tax=unclassified Streptomyces TaxID=2593676 RepID=UPI003432DA3E
MNAPHPAACYRIVPRYLAGPDPKVTDTLLRALPAQGWHVEHLGQAHAFDLREVDGLREALYVPDHLPSVPGMCLGKGWEFTARPAPGTPAAWRVSFAPATPPELIAALATALTHPDHDLADDVAPDPGAVPHYLHPPAAHPDGTLPLEAAGWIRDLGTDDCAWYAPGQQAAVVTPALPDASGSGATNWLFAARRAVDTTALWHATAHPNTPTHLIRALCTALTDPAPVPRPTRPSADIGAITLTRPHT